MAQDWRAHEYSRDWRGAPGFDYRTAQRQDFRDLSGRSETYGFSAPGDYVEPPSKPRGWREEEAAEIGAFFEDNSERRRSARHRDRMGAIRRSMRGLGPTPVRSNDEELRDAICHAMRDDHDLDASEVQIHVRRGEAILDGVVADEEQRRYAQRCADEVRGVRGVRNRLRTREHDYHQNAFFPW